MNKKISFPIAIIIIVVCATIVGGFAWQYRLIPGIGSIFTPTPKDETANWKTYRNEEYRFEIKYPKDWFVREDTSVNGIYFGEKTEVINIEGEKISIEKIGFTVIFYSNASKLWGNDKDNLLLEDWISKFFLPLREGEIRKTITFGVNNYNGILLKKYKGVGVIRLITIVYLERNSSIYELEGEVPTLTSEGFPTEYDYDKVFNRMLSTFRFLE